MAVKVKRKNREQLIETGKLLVFNPNLSYKILM
jgi:hypothetical protein